MKKLYNLSILLFGVFFAITLYRFLMERVIE